MRPAHPAAGSPWTWALTALFVVLLDVGVMHSSLLWGKTNLWVRGGKERLFLWQAYDVAGKLYGPRRDAEIRVALLGNSRAWVPARDDFVVRELKRLAARLDVRVDNLSMFGARIGDLEIVSRHIDRLQPSLVVLTLNGAELVESNWGKLINPHGELLDIGWRDGPLAPQMETVRVDRWVRTVWPFYRVRRFARAVINDRLFPTPGDTQFPDHFTSSRDYFDFIYSHGKAAAQAEARYQVWRRDQTLASFVAYLEPSSKAFGFNESLPEPESLTLQSPGVAVLDRLLARLAAGPWTSFVLLMPENPLLDADTEGKYHRLGFSEHAADLIRQVAERHHLRVVDGRRWMPAEAFVDFVHVFPDFSGFQTPLAKEILHAIDSR